jgi:hypothetical protein
VGGCYDTRETRLRAESHGKEGVIGSSPMLGFITHRCRGAGENPGSVIYGVIVIGALLAAERGRHETYLDTVGSAVIAIVAILALKVVPH